MELDNPVGLLVLGVGANGNTKVRAYCISLVLSALLGATPPEFGALESQQNATLFQKTGEKYVLTAEGQKVFDELLEKLKASENEDIARLLNTLEKVSTDNLVSMCYRLFPESAKTLIEQLGVLVKKEQRSGKKRFKIIRKGNQIMFEEL